MTEPVPVLNPADAEAKIAELSDRIARGVKIVTAAEREARRLRRDFDRAYAVAYKNADGPVHEKKYTADLEAMDAREAAEDAELVLRHAERTARALERELNAWQSISSSIRAMYSVRA